MIANFARLEFELFTKPSIYGFLRFLKSPIFGFKDSRIQGEEMRIKSLSGTMNKGVVSQHLRLFYS